MNKVRQQMATMLKVRPASMASPRTCASTTVSRFCRITSPTAPVVPGMCLVQAVLMAAEAQVGQGLRMRKLTSAKFMARALPRGANRNHRDGDTERSGTIQVKASLTSDGKRLAQVTLLASVVEEA